MYNKILAAHDGSQGAAKAFTAALRMAKRGHIPLHMISVEEVQAIPETMDEIVEDKLAEDSRYKVVIEQARREAESLQVPLEVHLLMGHPVLTIVDFISANRFDLLVIGFMGHTALYRRLIGSTTDRLVELVPCSVLVVK